MIREFEEKDKDFLQEQEPLDLLSIKGTNRRAHQLYHSLGFEFYFNQIELRYYAEK